MDRLIEAIDNTQNPSVVGLDPTEALVPPQVVASFADEVRDSVESPEEVESAAAGRRLLRIQPHDH